MSYTPISHRAPRRHWVGWTLLIVLSLVLVTMGVVIARASSIAMYMTQRAIPGMEARIGRKITVGDVHVRVFPRPGAKISHLVIGGGEREPALVDAPELRASVKLWSWIRSFGRNVEIDALELRDPVIQVVRRADGNWSYTEVVDGLTRDSTGTAQDREKTRTEISRLEITNGQLVMLDRSKGANTAGAGRLALEHIDVQASDLFEGQGKVRASAALASLSGKQNLRADFNLKPSVRGTVKLTSAALARFRAFLPEGLDSILRPGAVNLRADVAQSSNGTWALTGDIDLANLTVQNQPARASTHFKAGFTPDQDAVSCTFDHVDLEATGTRLGGTASFATTPPRGEFDLQGDKLDLGSLLETSRKEEPSPKEAGAEFLSQDVRARIAGAKFSGRLRLGKVVRGALEMSDLDARGDLQRGVFRLTEGRARLYGGALSVAGTSIDLREPLPKWNLEAHIDGTDLGQAMQQIAKVRPLEGVLSGALQLHGAGAQWPQVRSSMTGQGSLAVQKVTFVADIPVRFAESFARQLTAAGLPTATHAPQGLAKFGDLRANVAIENGWLRLTSPLEAETPLGTVHLGGRIGLDRALDLSGKVDVSPQFVASFSGGKIAPHGAMSVPVAIRGAVADPQFEITMSPAQVAELLVPPGPVARDIANLGRAVGGGPVPNLPGILNRAGILQPDAGASPSDGGTDAAPDPRR